MKPGHIVGAINIPFANLLDNKAKVLKSSDEIKQEFEKAGIDLNKPAVATCGSGEYYSSLICICIINFMTDFLIYVCKLALFDMVVYI